MVPELGFHRTLYLIQIRTENYLVELLDHLTGSKLTQIAAGLTGGTGGMLLRYIGETGAAFDLCLQLVALIFC